MKLANQTVCTGCSACVNICPQKCLMMSPDSKGFLFPELIASDQCINCDCCQRVCPVLQQEQYFPDNCIRCYAGYTKDNSMRKNSSSGGIFSELATAILKHGGVVYGAAYEDDNYVVQHICVEEERELSHLRGAKYAQSNLKSSFFDIKERLRTGQEVLFVGTPCQVAGLKAFLGGKYENLFTIDFVCHGVPSPLIWERYVQYRAEKDNNGTMPININLRSKKTGWSRYQYSNEYQYENGKMYSARSDEDLFMRLFVGDYINRESCTNCHFKGYERISDITLGDFWGIWDVAPEMDDNKGTSLILVHSQSAKEILEQLSDRIILKEVTLQQASKQNPSMLVSSPAHSKREVVIQKCLDGEFDELQKYFEKNQTSLKTSFTNTLLRVWNKMKRILTE